MGIDGKRGYLIENTHGNRGFVEALNGLNDLSIRSKEFEQNVESIIGQPNFIKASRTRNGMPNVYDIMNFDKKLCQRRIKISFRHILTRQDARSMQMQMSFGGFGGRRNVKDSYIRAHRQCASCDKYEEKVKQ